MVMPQLIEHPNAVRLMHTAPLNDWSHELWSRSAASATSTTTSSRLTSATSSTATSSTTTATTATTTSVQHQRLQRATDPEVMAENDFNRNRKSRREVSNASAHVATSPKSTSSNSGQLVQPPPPIEDLMMADVQEQKASSDNETSAPKDKATKGKRKHVATGNPRGRPP
jgi:hypothetical protein